MPPSSARVGRASAWQSCGPRVGVGVSFGSSSAGDRPACGDGALIGCVVRFMMRGHHAAGWKPSVRCRRSDALVVVTSRSVAWAAVRAVTLALCRRLLPQCDRLVDWRVCLLSRRMPLALRAAVIRRLLCCALLCRGLTDVVQPSSRVARAEAVVWLGVHWVGVVLAAGSLGGCCVGGFYRRPSRWR